MSHSTPPQKVTMQDVARLAKVSVATVSNVFNGRGSVGEQVKERVLQVASDINYVQNRAARTMKVGRSEILGLIVPNIENPYFANLTQEIMKETQKRGYQVFFVGTEGSHDNEEAAIRSLVKQGVDGIILFPVDEDLEIELGSFNIPIVVLDRYVENAESVQAEYTQGGQLLAQHLLQLGHRKFGMLEGPRCVSASRERSQGFENAIAGIGEIIWSEEHPYTLKLTEQAITQLSKQNVSAIICGNDMIAIGTIFHLQSKGIKVPDDVSVCGFDDINLASLVSPSLTTIRIRNDLMAYEAVSLLLRRIEESASDRRNRVLIGVDLVSRQSTKAISQ